MKNKKKQENNVNIYMILAIVTIMFAGIISVEVLLVNNRIKRNNNKHSEVTTVLIVNNELEGINDYNFTDISMDNNQFYINDICRESGCALKNDTYKEPYYYIVSKTEDNYYLTILKNTKILLSEKNIGNNIENAYINYYFNDVIFYNIINNTSDYMCIVNEEGSLDEFMSSNAKEIELTNTGINYYEHSCEENNTYRRKIERMPFEITGTIIEEEKEYPWWCE